MKRLLSLSICCALIAPASLAADAPAAAAAPAAPASPNPEIQAAYVDLLKREVEFGAVARFLKEMSAVHAQRSEAALQSSRRDKAEWESDLSRDLAERATEMAGQLTQVNRQRIEFEEKHKIPGTPQFTVGALAGPPGLNADELTYLARLDNRIWTLDQDLASVVDAGKALTSSLQTNTEIEEITRITTLIQDNSRQVRDVERQRADVELKKLEYRALRRKP